MRVKEIIKERGITSKELAEKIEMSEVGLSIALSDRGNPSLSTLKKIAEVLNIPIAELFGEKYSEMIGFVEYKGTTCKVTSFDDLRKLLELEEK